MTTNAECFSGVCAADLVGGKNPPTQTAEAATGGAVSCLLQQTSLVATGADVKAGYQPANEDM